MNIPILKRKKYYYNILRDCINDHFYYQTGSYSIYFITSSEFNAYQMKVKLVFSTVRKYHIFSLVTDTIYIFTVE